MTRKGYDEIVAGAEGRAEDARVSESGTAWACGGAGKTGIPRGTNARTNTQAAAAAISQS